MSFGKVFYGGNSAEHNYWTDMYFKPYVRIPTYLLGCFIAWAYLSSKDKKYSYKLWDKINNMFHIKAVRYILYLLGFALLSLCIFIAGPYNEHYQKVTLGMDLAFIVL